MYLLSDFFGLWHAMQFWTRIGATSLRKLTGARGSSIPGPLGRGIEGSVERSQVAADSVRAWTWIIASG